MAKIFKTRIFSGIQPTGVPHIGNYFGAIKQWVDVSMISNGQCNGSESMEKPIFCVVDLHALTSNDNSHSLLENIYSTFASLLACQINLNNSILFKQSSVLEHTYLSWILGSNLPTSRLNNLSHFREKAEKYTKQSVPLGLFSYPTLQAADILLYKANRVPVGADQSQHIELTRFIARKFNVTYKQEIFPEPEAIYGKSDFSQRVKSLRDPMKKMSKSDPNKKSRIEITDEPDVILEKCKKAITDMISDVYYDPVNRPGVSNLLVIYSLITNDPIEVIVERHKKVNTSQFKVILADLMVDYFKPIREKYKLYNDDRGYLDKVMLENGQLARHIASQTISDVNKCLGIP